MFKIGDIVKSEFHRTKGEIGTIMGFSKRNVRAYLVEGFTPKWGRLEDGYIVYAAGNLSLVQSAPVIKEVNPKVLLSKVDTLLTFLRSEH